MISCSCHWNLPDTFQYRHNESTQQKKFLSGSDSSPLWPSWHTQFATFPQPERPKKDRLWRHFWRSIPSSMQVSSFFFLSAFQSANISCTNVKIVHFCWFFTTPWVYGRTNHLQQFMSNNHWATELQKTWTCTHWTRIQWLDSLIENRLMSSEEDFQYPSLNSHFWVLALTSMRGKSEFPDPPFAALSHTTVQSLCVCVCVTKHTARDHFSRLLMSGYVFTVVNK